MKTMLLLTIALAPPALLGQSQPCALQNSVLNGVYMVRNIGTVAAVNGNPIAFAIAFVGLATFDGQGSWQITFTGSFNGNIFRGFSSAGTYTVNRDCTGSLTFGTGPSTGHFDLVITPDGKQ